MAVSGCPQLLNALAMFVRRDGETPPRVGLLAAQLDSRFGSMLIGEMPAAGVEVDRLPPEGLKFAEDYASARLVPDQP